MAHATHHLPFGADEVSHRILKHILQQAPLFALRCWPTTWPESSNFSASKGINPATAFRMVDLPEPLSPTIPKVSPSQCEAHIIHGAEGAPGGFKRDLEVLNRDHVSHAGSRVTVASMSRGSVSSGTEAINARV